MLVFPTGVARHFANQYADLIAYELPGFKLAREKAMPGEDTVLRNFSSEWVNYDWDDRTYWNLTPNTMYECINFLLDLRRKPVRDKLVLEAGVGIAGIADYMASREECELVGIDLSYAVDPAYEHFGRNCFLHLVQASVFALPFAENSFDFVYSMGVLHHTFSTKFAFNQVCKLPKRGGRLFVWVYSPNDEQRTLKRRILMFMEKLIRPFCWRLPESLQTLVLLPIIPLYLIHQNFYVRWSGKGYIKYGWREAMHAARDRFSQRYAHRHTENEVAGWFRDAGYINIVCSSKYERPDFVPISFLTSTGVDGIRS